MKNEKKYKNGLGIASLILFLIGIIVLGLGVLFKHLDGSEYGGFFIIFAIFFAGVPFLMSGVLALINICNYYSKKCIIKCNKLFLVFDWCIIATIILPYVFIQIYNIILFIINMIGR
jgi:hypothetical protein